MAPGQVGVVTGRLSPGDKGVNMKLTIDNMSPGDKGVNMKLTTIDNNN